MLLNIADHLEAVMTFQGVFLMTWAAILVTDAVIVKKFMKIGPGYYEVRQRNLYKWNPVGVGSLIIANNNPKEGPFSHLTSFLTAMPHIINPRHPRTKEQTPCLSQNIGTFSL
uniref:Uncharacterized protein n=1 Tax=Virgibacillus oceani TaxID=1479511 RepID=A0A917HFM4_9BACI|nr:hypothetical protein GCM10011398_22740 [Virgibacillus oceani]